ncbi:MAG TPA: Stk1 family PASTA domain-containing Ser/Thr kinase [Trebonia sp.]
MESVLADALIGQTLDGRYHVRSRIAHGGMATVFLATDTRLDRQVALKVMHAELARDADFVDRFIGEAKSVAGLSHPNIVSVFDQGSDGQSLYLAMEYVPGRTLRSLIRERRWFPAGEALEIMDPILAGLAAAHRSGVVHRDVKPENVLLTADGRVKVVDFGLARAQAAAGQTRAGVIIGTVAYIAPEQVTGGVTDFRTDVYGAGVMLFEMLTGRQPHTGDSPLAVAYKHVNEEIPAPSQWVGGIPPAVDQLVRAATSRDPRRRPPDAETFMRTVRMLRGIGDESDALTGAWANPGGAAALDGPDGSQGASHTMVVFAGPGYGGPGYGYGDSGYGQTAGYRAEHAYGNQEPFLQRWLFSKRLGLVAVGVAAVIAVGSGAWWLTSGQYTPLPSVAGQPVTRAEEILHANGFQTQQGTWVTDNNVARGDVISMSPAGRATHGALITLTVSSGPHMISVPSVSGQPSVAAAEAVLRKAGLTVAAAPRNVAANGVPVGTVAGTTPAAGTLWPQNSVVYVDVAAGMALPNLSGQSIQTIQGWAGQNNIQLNPVNVASSQPAGIIVGQSPAPGTPITPGQTVTVNVSSGPPSVPIPDLRGQNFQQAQQELQKLGFQVTGQQLGPGNTVLGTSPGAGTPEPPGTNITVFYGF